MSHSKRCEANWVDYPFVVFFSEDRPGTGKQPYQYTGTVVGERFLLTAAHNLFNRDRKQGVKVENLTVVFSNGEKRSGGADICPRFYCCPSYVAETDSRPIGFDAALIQLCKPVPVQPVDWSTDDDGFPDFVTVRKL